MWDDLLFQFQSGNPTNTNFFGQTAGSLNPLPTNPIFNSFRQLTQVSAAYRKQKIKIIYSSSLIIVRHTLSTFVKTLLRFFLQKAHLSST
jgi:hypothetical protein